MTKALRAHSCVVAGRSGHGQPTPRHVHVGLQLQHSAWIRCRPICGSPKILKAVLCKCSIAHRWATCRICAHLGLQKTNLVAGCGHRGCEE